MKLWVFSDIHTDVNRRYQFELPDPRPEHDVVIVAGDICEGTRNAVQWIVAHGLNAKPVILVAGNHEFYTHDIDGDFADGMREAMTHDNVHLLDNAGVYLTGPMGERVAIDGATLWTDYLYWGEGDRAKCMAAAAAQMNDHRLIRVGRRALTPEDCAARFDISYRWLKQRIDAVAAAKREGKLDAHVVVTHHAISEKSVAPKFKADRLTAAFASRLDRLVGKADVWVHGHVHNQSRYSIGNCEVVANPRGYVMQGESEGFDPALVIEVGRQQPASMAKPRAPRSAAAGVRKRAPKTEAKTEPKSEAAL